MSTICQTIEHFSTPTAVTGKVISVVNYRTYLLNQYELNNKFKVTLEKYIEVLQRIRKFI